MALFEVERSLLTVVDIQERLGAVMPAKVLGRVIKNTSLLLRAATLLEVPVIATEQYPRGLGPMLPELTADLPANTRKLEKTSFSCTGAPGFNEQLSISAKEQIILVGMEAHVCVLQTAITLQAAGRQVCVIEDAVCSRKLENYQNALERLRQAGVVLVSTESVLFEWLGDASHQHFKEISSWLR